MITLSMCLGQIKETAGRNRPAGPWKRWGAFLCCLFLIWAFIYVVAPWLMQRSPSIQTLGNYIEESGIDAGAIYYTEVEEVGEADLAIRNTFRFYLKDNQEEAAAEKKE